MTKFAVVVLLVALVCVSNVYVSAQLFSEWNFPKWAQMNLMPDNENKGLSPDEVRNMRPENGTDMNEEIHSESSSVQMINGKVVKHTDDAMDIVNNNGNVTENESHH